MEACLEVLCSYYVTALSKFALLTVTVFGV